MEKETLTTQGISKDTEVWLRACWNSLLQTGAVQPFKHIKLATLNKTSKDFKPWKIDSKLLKDQTEITIHGLIAIGEGEMVLDISNKVFVAIRNQLMNDIDLEEFNLQEIADIIEEDRRIVSIAYTIVSSESLSLWNSAGSNSSSTFGFETLTIKDRALNTYLDYNSIYELFEAHEKEVEEYRNQMKLQKKFNRSSYPINTRGVNVELLFSPEILLNTRGYIESVGDQANACFNYGIYDGALVLVRKLLEMLIIECYEKFDISHKITDDGGDYYNLSALITSFSNEPKWKISRNTKSAMPQIKKFGDLSAHNRRFSAKRDDLMKISDDLRVTIEELVHLIGYHG